MQALEALNKKDLGEIKAYNNPPELVETVMQAVMILRQSDPTWGEAKRQLGDTNFIKQLVDFDKDNMSDKGTVISVYSYMLCVYVLQWFRGTCPQCGDSLV